MRNRFDFNFTPMTLEETASLVISAKLNGYGGRVATPNLHFYYLISKDPKLLEIYNNHDLILCDSMIIYQLIRFYSRPLPMRVTGSDLLEMVIDKADKQGFSIAILGGTTQDCIAAQSRIRTEYPNLKLVHLSSPQISDMPSHLEVSSIIQSLEGVDPDIFVLSFGTPKQEFLGVHLAAIYPSAWILNIGGGLSFFAGTKKRSPLILQRMGLEWLWRLISEPRRLFRRYVIQDLPTLYRLIRNLRA
jgi:N-acetylglucosaminyldiphosphoundecaprenol N-acetyl-beta-D-mannosaminyltransferase